MTFTCGCSTIRTVSLPGDNPVLGEREDTDLVAGRILEITDVRVTLQKEEPLVGNEIEDSPAEATPLTTVPREEIANGTGPGKEAS